MPKLSPALYDLRYAPNWPDVRRVALQKTNGVCCTCDRPAEEVHHAMYKDHRGPVMGAEVPGVHIFPLCKKCHKVAHLRRYWIHDWNEPLFGNHNTDSYLLVLRIGYLNKLSES